MRILKKSKTRSHLSLFVRLFCALLLTACQFGCSREPQASATIQVLSPDFQSGTAIPKRFTCDGGGLSPALSWQNLPANTKSLALIMNDSDSLFGRFVHWISYNIPPQPNRLTEGLPTQETLPNGAKQGLNSDKAIGYTGPCPPGTSAHHYVFAIYALDTVLNLLSRPSKKELTNAMRGHVLATGQLIGQYHR
jgi:Raf kinase inhibitor-like YbhB/YbcL family protein